MSDDRDHAACRDTFDLVHGFVIASMQGELAEDEITDFEQLLRDRPDARRQYAVYLADTIKLPGILSAPGLKVAVPLETKSREPAKTPDSIVAPATPPQSPVLGFLGGVVDYISHSRRLMLLLVAVMLSGWFVFQIGSVLIGRWWNGDAQVADHGLEAMGTVRAGQKSDPSAGPNPLALHPNALAWLSGSVGGRWQVVAENPAGGVPATGNMRVTGNPAEPAHWDIGTEFIGGQQVELVAGLAEITFRSGAKVVVSAPAQFSVTSPLGADLQVGKLAARVPHTASGFTVKTPLGSVVDLGTEFGVEVTPDHKLDVQVFVGDVKISDPSGSAGDEPAPDVHVSAGKTVHVEPGKPATLVESQDNRFQRDLKIARDSSDKQMAAYLDLMRQLKPVVWLRMEGKDADRTIHNEIGSSEIGSSEVGKGEIGKNLVGELHWDGPGNPFTKGRVGKGLWLRGPEVGDYAMLADYPKAEHGKLSVSAWVYADSRPVWPTIAANWRENRAEGQFQFGLYSTAPAAGVDLYVALTPAEGQHFYLREGEAHPFPLHEWQHVAFTTDGSTVRLYRQGREVAAQRHAGLKYPVPIRSLALGATFDASDKAPGKQYPAWWDGKLDEIAVFNDTLSAENIQKLAAAPPQ